MAASRCAFYFNLFVCGIANPQVWVQFHPALPSKYSWRLKIKFWSSFFHILLYIVGVASRSVRWYNATWLLKAAMAIWSLVGLQKASTLRRRWPLERFGVLSARQCPWPLANVWRDWSFAAAQAFRWDESADMWRLLRGAKQEGPDCSPEQDTLSGPLTETLPR